MFHDLMEQSPCELFQKVTGFLWHDCNQRTEPNENASASIGEMLVLYRLILAQLRSADPVSRKTLSRNLTFLIIRDSGLRELLTATFDFDASSQHVTTFDQRFQAMANLIAAPPVICCPLSHYFQRISIQIHSLMRQGSLSDDVHSSICKVCTLTANSMINRNRDAAVKAFVQPITSSISTAGGLLSPQNCIDVICGLAVADFDLSLLLNAFPAFLFAYCSLEQAVHKHHYLALTEFVKRVDNSVYMIDDALFNHFIDCGTCYKSEKNSNGKFSIVFTPNDSPDSSLVIVDRVTVVTLKLVSAALAEEHQIDFLLVLMERLSFRHLMSPDCGFLLCSLIAVLIEKIEPLFAKFPRKWVRFISETLTRLHHDNRGDPISREESCAPSKLQMDTLSIVVQILRILVAEREKLQSDDIHAIKSCISDIIKSEGKSLICEDLASLVSDLSDQKDDSENKRSCDVDHVNGMKENFEDALRDLNDPLMPTRAHGLICLKRLVLRGDKAVLTNWKRVLQLLEISLSDGESYIYLSAINTLAALSLTRTEQSLPILMQAFQNEDRTIQERLNVAEVIVRVIRNLGEAASQFCHLFFGTFMHSLEDSDEMIRVSSLSNLALFCSRLGPSLKSYFGEVLHVTRSIFRKDKSLQVKRACVMLLHVILSGIDGETFEVVQEQGSQLLSLMQETYSCDPDDICRLHAQLALEEMDRIARDRLCCALKRSGSGARE